MRTTTASEAIADGNDVASTNASAQEPYDDPEEHHRVEKHRFAGGLPATPERYALAREQWYRLPGAVVRPSMAPGFGAPAPEPQSPEQTLPGGKGPEQ